MAAQLAEMTGVDATPTCRHFMAKAHTFETLDDARQCMRDLGFPSTADETPVFLNYMLVMDLLQTFTDNTALLPVLRELVALAARRRVPLFTFDIKDMLCRASSHPHFMCLLAKIEDAVPMARRLLRILQTERRDERADPLSPVTE